MSATEVIIQFVGLCLFSAAVPNDPGVHAILPKITAPHRYEKHEVIQVTQKDFQTVPEPTLDDMKIEQHVAMLVFPAGIIEDESRWKTGPVPNARGALQGYKQIRLDGEHVTFQVDGLNVAAAVPPNMPRLGCPLTAGIAPPAFTAGYQFPYDEAAAVIDIPKGRLSACNPGGARVDTTLRLQTSGRLMVVGMKEGVSRSLVLRTDDNPRVFVLNIPDHTSKKLDGVGSAEHYLAYYAMVGKGMNNSCERPTPPDGEHVVEKCDGLQIARVVYSLTGVVSDALELVLDPDVLTAQMANTECSNSAWP